MYFELSSELDVESPPDPFKSKLEEYVHAAKFVPRISTPSPEDTFSLPLDQKEDQYGATSEQPSGKWDELQSFAHCHVDYKDADDRKTIT